MPKVKARAIRRADGQWDLIVFSCPFCGGRHIHGGGRADKPSQYGHRQPHCVTYSNQGYVLIPDGHEFAKVAV